MLQLMGLPVSSSTPFAVTLVSAAFGRRSSRNTWPLKVFTSAPAPTTRLPAGQVAVALLFAELSALVAATRSRPGSGGAHSA